MPGAFPSQADPGARSPHQGNKQNLGRLWGFGNDSNLLTKCFLKPGLSLCRGWQDGLLSISDIRRVRN